MKNTPMQCFESDCGNAKIYVNNNMPIGIFHDFLMEMKGHMVDRMVDAHKKQEKEIQEHEALERCDEKCSDEVKE